MTYTDARVHTSFEHLKSLQNKAKKLRILGRQQAKSILSGRHGSRIRGRGLSFEELRDYRVGDDIRTIDWRVTARTGTPHVRVYSQEKDKSSLIIVDQRMTMFFGTRRNMKSVTASETASLIAYSLLAQGDRIGGVLFNDTEIESFKPSKRSASMEYFIKRISDYNCQLSADADITDPPMHLNTPLEAANRLVSHDQLIFVLSDFAEVNEQTKQYLYQLTRHNSVVLCLITDHINTHLPRDMRLSVSNGEKQMILDTYNKAVYQSINSTFNKRVGLIHAWQNELNLTVIPFCASIDSFQQLKQALAL